MSSNFVDFGDHINNTEEEAGIRIFAALNIGDINGSLAVLHHRGVLTNVFFYECTLIRFKFDWRGTK